MVFSFWPPARFSPPLGRLFYFERHLGRRNDVALGYAARQSGQLALVADGERLARMAPGRFDSQGQSPRAGGEKAHAESHAENRGGCRRRQAPDDQIPAEDSRATPRTDR